MIYLLALLWTYIIVFVLALSYQYGNCIYLAEEDKATESESKVYLVAYQNFSTDSEAWTAEAAEMASQQAWWCAWCRKDVKAAFNHCGFCGASWQESQQQQQQPRAQSRRRQTWNYTGDWHSQDQGPWAPQTKQHKPKPKSPRRRGNKSPRQQPKDRAGPKKTSSVPDPEPEWDSQVDQERTSATDAQTEKAEMLLQELAQAVQKSEQPLDTQVQTVLSKVNIKPPDPSKQMHSATSRLDNARLELQRAKDAKKNLHKNWGAFLAAAVKRWEAHSAKFTEEDKDLQDAIDRAMVTFKEARAHFEATKELVTLRDQRVTEVHEVSDEELMQDATPSVTSDMAQMLTSLTKIRERQEEMEEQMDDPATKKARRSEHPDHGDDPGDDGVGSTKPSALMPFGRGGK
eukprot:s70_g48.t1